MPISLRTFLEKKGCNTDSLDELLLDKMYRNPPICQTTMQSEHYSKRYRGMIEGDFEGIKAQTVIAEYMLYYVSFMDPPRSILFKEKEEDRLFRHELYRRAALFDLTGFGNCANRCSYSGIVLYQMLRHSGLRVIVKSAEKVDQYMVHIGTNAQWYVYDPLTNPEILFPQEEYERDVLEKFFTPPVVDTRTAIYHLEMGPKRVEPYFELLNRYRDAVIKKIDRLDSEGLEEDLDIMAHLERLQIKEPAQQLKSAIAAFQCPYYKEPLLRMRK